MGNRKQDMGYRKTVLSVIAACFLMSGVTSFSFLGTYETKADLISIDNFGNYYTASENKVFKFSSDGVFLYPFEEFKYGKIEMIDVSNPMKIMVFCPDFLTVIVLDKFLSPLSTYSFFDLGYQNISAVASSTDGNLWFYDNTDFKLKKIDETGTIYQESQPLNIIVGAVPNPNFMVEKNDFVYLNDPAIGIMVFDVFGSYSKTIPIRGLKKFEIFQDQVIYFDSNKLSAYNFVMLDLKALSLPDSTGITGAAIQKDRLGILKKDRVDFYKY